MRSDCSKYVYNKRVIDCYYWRLSNGQLVTRNSIVMERLMGLSTRLVMMADVTSALCLISGCNIRTSSCLR